MSLTLASMGPLLCSRERTVEGDMFVLRIHLHTWASSFRPRVTAVLSISLQGAGSREQDAGSREQGARSKEQGARSGSRI